MALEPLCAESLHSCICNLPFAHTGAHVCKCEGSWDDEGNIEAMPSLVVEEGGRFPMGSRPFGKEN